jgi:tetratricopeptide (TPR) repeat protein
LGHWDEAAYDAASFHLGAAPMKNIAKVFRPFALMTSLLTATTASQAIPIGASAPPPGPLREAFLQVSQGHLDAAEKAFLAFKAKDPKAPDPYLGLAYIAIQKHDLATARRTLDDGIGAATNNSRLYLTRGRVLVLQGQIDPAASDLEKAAGLDRTNTEALLALGDLYLGPQRQPQKALGYYQRVTAISANSAAGYFGTGIALAMSHQNQAAIAAFKRSEIIAPGNPQPSIEVARIYAGEHKFLDALGLLELVTKKFPKSFDALMLKGAVHAALGQQDRAIGALNAALLLQPNSLEALTALGAAARTIGKLDVAENAYKRALVIAPQSPMVLNSYAWMLASVPSRLDQALTMATKAVNIAPQEAAFHDTKGFVLMQRHDVKAAIVEFQKAVAIDPNSEARTHLAAAQAGR